MIFSFFNAVLTLSILLFKFRHKGKRKTDLSQSRQLLWFRQILLDALISSDNYSRNIASEVNRLLGLDFTPVNEIYLNSTQTSELIYPDLENGEKELMEIEMRMSKIQILIIFIPILYTTICLTASLSVFNQIALLINFVLLIQFYSQTMALEFDIKGWTHLVEIIKSSFGELLISPHLQIFKFDGFFKNVYHLELGDPLIPRNQSGSCIAITCIYHILLNFHSQVHEYVLNEFVRNTKSLPTLEKLYLQKKSIYSRQFIIICLALCLFIVILSSITMIFSSMYKIYQENLPLNFFIFSQNNPNLGIFTILLTSSLVYIFSGEFYSEQKQIFLSSVLLFSCLTLYFIITTAFMLILTLN